MRDAFAYLLRTSYRNRLRRQAQRIRSPRYAIAFLVGLAYLGFMIFGRALGRSAGVTPYMTLGPSLAPLFIVVMVISSWLLSADATALAFTQAEVSLLFTAPVSRRGLIIYKLVSAQIPILISAMLMVFFLGRGSQTIPHVLSGLGYWTMLSTINMHGLGAALMRARSQERTKVGAGPRRLARVFTIIVSTTIMLAIVGPSMASTRGAGGGGPFAFVNQIAAWLALPVPHMLLAPFRLVIAPAFAVSVGDWLRAFAPALAILALHAWWVIGADTAFEEAAAEASERRAKMIEAMRARRGTAPTAPTKATRTISLAGTGWPPLAIVWKNTLALLRLIQFNQLVMPVVLSIVMAATARRGSGDTAQSVAFGLLLFTVMLAITGALVVRNDLRSDMLHLPFLKSLPLSGRDIVLAEVVSGALPLAAVEVLLLVIASVALAISTHTIPVSLTVRVGLLVSAPLVLVAFNIAVFTVHNATAVLFPAWIRLGPSSGGGIELMGQAMLTMFGTLLAITLLLIIPAVSVALMYYLIAPASALVVAAGLSVGAALLLFEALGLIALLGRSFERTEPTQVA